ncbi:AAA family ATPase [Ideonella sp.]|uniref:AAA family ATPase n=1 Tax=Ideonella sp. TaxID=1929293 RepID=UPI0035B03A58
MSTRFRRGLVVGKFSPLHRGHEWLIETARAACGELLVLSYSQPEFDRCDAAARERWLQARCPGVKRWVLDDARLARLCAQRSVEPRHLPPNDAPDEVQRRFVGSLLLDLLGTTVDAVFTSESYGDGFAASLTAQFRAINPGHAPVVHVCVDAARTTRPVSGSAVRAAPAAWRAMVAPEVYADLVPRLCLLGGESSGKTTLAQALAERLGTTWVPEYGRERWEQVGGVLSVDELVHVAQVQVQREIDAAPTAHGWLVCDTSPLTTLQYCLLDHGAAPAELQQLARRPYDLAVLCDGDFGFVQDGTRRDDAFRAEQQARTAEALQKLRANYVTVRGGVEERIEQVLAALHA